MDKDMIYIFEKREKSGEERELGIKTQYKRRSYILNMLQISEPK